MKTPLEALQDTIIVPAYNFYNNYIGKNARHRYCKKAANFIFNCSKETALVMLLFNAVSVVSSHIAQISGLKKSDRENKDYLITQEKKELMLDLVLTIIPPFMLNNFLKKKLESGVWTTKEAKEKLVNHVAPVVGASREELYSIEHIRPVKETVGVISSNVTSTVLKNGRKMPRSVKDKINVLDKNIKSKLPDNTLKLPAPTLEDIATDFDNMAKQKRVSQNVLKPLRNGSAYDELCGMNNGILILATVGYTIIASNIIMPILKNIMANKSYEKQLAKAGETKESIKRKKRYEFTKEPLIFSDNNLFDEFTLSSDLASSSKQENIFKDERKKEPEKQHSVFNTFNTYNSRVSQSTGLRI